MPRYCNVAVPVPLDATFTYSIPEDLPEPCVGGRVIVPFREKRLCGVVIEVHDREPSFKAKSVQQALDTTPALTDELMQLGRWIAHYYIAPIGEVLRTMLPLSAEFRRTTGYRITEKGLEALHAASTIGSSRRAKVEPEHQMREYAVLNRLAEGEVMREATLRSSAGASREVLVGLLRKKWIAREDLSGVRDASRNIQVATLADFSAGANLKQPEHSEVERDPSTPARKSGAPPLRMTPNQQAIVDYLRLQANQRAHVSAIRELAVPRTTLQTLVRRGIVEISEEPASFRISGMKPRQLEFLFNAAQKAALAEIGAAVDAGKFLPMLLHGVTGSGKTAVYLSAMQAMLAKGRSAILLVPEIGLTPAMAADLHQIFGDEVVRGGDAGQNDECCGSAGLSHALAGDLLQRATGQIQADGAGRAH